MSKKAKITFYPPPEPSRDKRAQGVTGTVVLRVVLCRSGQVTDIEPVVNLNIKEINLNMLWSEKLLYSTMLASALMSGSSITHAMPNIQLSKTPSTMFASINLSAQTGHVEKGTKHLQRQEYSEALKEAEAALLKKPGFAPALLLKSQALIGLAVDDLFGFLVNRAAASKKFKEAASILEDYLFRIPFRINRPAEDNDRNTQIEALRRYSELLADTSNPEPAVYLPKEITTKARILRRVQPNFTPAASVRGVTGKVILLAVLGQDGSVRNVLPVQTLPNGLTDEAIKAAQATKFEPAMKDGRAVPQMIRFEYTFSK